MRRKPVCLSNQANSLTTRTDFFSAICWQFCWQLRGIGALKAFNRTRSGDIIIYQSGGLAVLICLSTEINQMMLDFIRVKPEHISRIDFGIQFAPSLVDRALALTKIFPELDILHQAKDPRAYYPIHTSGSELRGQSMADFASSRDKKRLHKKPPLRQSAGNTDFSETALYQRSRRILPYSGEAANRVFWRII